MDFYSFLTNYVENFLDIECKKNTFYIYEKNLRFGTPGINNIYLNIFKKGL